jgi:uncharacterized alkaline shock family protein YloU
VTTNETDLGKIEISPTAIATLAVETALSSYGVVGLANRSKFDDWRRSLLHGVYAQPGVTVSMQDNAVVVDLYIVIEYGTRISEVARSVMHRVQYTLEQTVGLPVGAVNIHVQGLRVSGHTSSTPMES